MLLFFGILKIRGFVYVRMIFILYLQTWRRKPAHFAKLASERAVCSCSSK